MGVYENRGTLFGAFYNKPWITELGGGGILGVPLCGGKPICVCPDISSIVLTMDGNIPKNMDVQATPQTVAEAAKYS